MLIVHHRAIPMQITPASSVCKQKSERVDWHSTRRASDPVHRTRLNRIGPVPGPKSPKLIGRAPTTHNNYSAIKIP